MGKKGKNRNNNKFKNKSHSDNLEKMEWGKSLLTLNWMRMKKNDNSGAHGLGNSAPHHFSNSGPHHIGYSGPHHIGYSGPHHIGYSGPHHVVKSGPHYSGNFGSHEEKQYGTSVKPKTNVSSSELYTEKVLSDDISFHDYKDMFLNMDLNEKRNWYKCQDKFEQLSGIHTLHEMYCKKIWIAKQTNFEDYPPCESFNKKLSVFKGDICRIEIDAIVNAANKELIRGGGVDEVIHKAASRFMQEECRTLNGCEVGDAKVTGGYLLPAKYVIHAVGPRGEIPCLLANAYIKSLYRAIENGIRTIAFPSISTGVYGYPPEKAVKVVLQTIRIMLEANEEYFDRIVFVTYDPKDYDIYRKNISFYFPPVPMQ